ncbi:MAG TPA: hypothetical protein VNI84_16480 [Pyrinomonadaceae bacterium]|nr:hypothetical protein [Pyrinomonadaceae bacterium]
MSRKTITKNCLVVISLAVFCLNFAACSPVSSSGDRNGSNNTSKTDKNASNAYEKPKVVGTISSGEITESSGIAASRCAENVFWTHNDSGDDAFLFAINVKGEKLGTWKVSNAKNNDWEDIAAFKDAKGECSLYVGDIGNNERMKSELTIYRVKEPKISDADKSSSKKNPVKTENAAAIKINYPDMRRDAETLLVHPQTGDIYVLSKSFSQPSGVYKLAANYDSNKPNTLKKIADFAVPAVPNGLLTGGDISPDGKSVILCDYFNGYEITLPQNAKDFDEIWKQKPQIADLGAREQGEAIGYALDGKSVFATSEKRNQPLIEARKK